MERTFSVEELYDLHPDTYPLIPNGEPVEEWETLRLPLMFYEDRESRALAVPEPMRQTKRHVWVSMYNPAMYDYEHDADFYSDASMFDSGVRGICLSAQATLKAIAKWEAVNAPA